LSVSVSTGEAGAPGCLRSPRSPRR
jgi:hypothetical protein